MTPEVGKIATKFALFLIVTALLTLRWVSKGSAEFVVLVLVIVLGVIMLGLVALLARLNR